MVRWFVAGASLALAMVCFGCDDGGSSSGADRGADRGPISDQEVEGPAVDAEPDGEAEIDAGPDAIVDAEPDQGADARIDAATERMIDTCEQACGRYAECGRLADRFGDEATCLRQCGRIARNGRPDTWFDCLEEETCGLMHLCPVPPLTPLTCQEICDQTVTCEAELPTDDCPAACEAAGEPFRRCGEALDGECGVADFRACLLTDVFPQCGAICGPGAQCNLVRPRECEDECIGGLLSEDPLYAVRARQLGVCITAAGADCARMDLCFHPPLDAGPAVDEATFCRRYSDCGFGEFFFCEEFVDEVGPDGLRCADEVLRQGCPFDEFDLFDRCFGGGGVDPRVAPCTRLCEGQDLCGLLGAGQRQNCINGCIGGGGGDPDLGERGDAQLACANAERCPELRECLSMVGPGAECAALCQSLDGCGLADADCLATCDAAWARDRHADYRACVADAGADCAAMAACAFTPNPLCGPYCDVAGADGCGVIAAGCVGRCDDADFADPVATAQRIACVLTAPACFADFGVPRPAHDVATCITAPAFGQACLGFCRARVECAGAPEPMAQCLEDCGLGFVGDEGLVFEAAQDCLAALPADAACPAVVACVPEDANADCDALCARAEGCDLSLRDCPVACAEDPLARLRALRAETCAPPEADCGVFAECLQPAERLAPVLQVVPQVEFCEAWDQCDDLRFGFGECEFNYDFYSRTANLSRCIYGVAQACAGDVFEQVFTCEDGEFQPVHPLTGACASLCEAQRFCAAGPFDQPACEAACRGQVAADDIDGVARLRPRMACAGSWSCPDLRDCLQNSAPAQICAEQCGRRQACGLADDARACVTECDDGFARGRQATFRACVDAAGEDCDALALCAPPPAPPCAEYCARVVNECGLEADNGCITRCDDAHAADPGPALQRIACVLTAPACFPRPGLDPPDHNVEDCLGGAAHGEVCLGFCRAETECAGEPDGLAGCVGRCAAGLVGDEGLRLQAATDCLSGLPPDAACGALRGCVPADAGPDCARVCGAADACGLAIADCAGTCADDPLARLHALRGQACVDAADCPATAECLFPALPPPDPPPALVPRAQFCAAWDACPDLAFDFGPCVGIYDQIVDIGPEFMACVFEAASDCGPDAFDALFICQDQVVVAPHPLDAACDRLCEARRYCGLEDNGQRECVVACTAQVDAADADGLARLAPRMDCGGAWACPELGACLDASTPAAICAAQCAARAGCGLEDDLDNCAADCLRDFPRARAVAHRDCLAAAGDACDGIAACEPPPPLPCGIACDVLSGCLDVGRRCVADCDDAAFADPAGSAQQIACLIAADDCRAVNACEADPSSGGGACLGWCRAVTDECTPGAIEDLATCLGRCLTGFGDDTGLAFAAAADCLDAAGPDAACRDLLGCVPPAPPPVDCDAFCGALTDCRIDAADCLADCRAAPDRVAAACTLDARRNGQRCRGVAACVGYVPPPADAVCRDLCDRVSACDRDVDAFLCRRDCTPTPPEVIAQQACAELADCGTLADCLALEADPLADCVRLCGPAVACGLFADPDVCAAVCTGRDASPRTPPTYTEHAADCLDAAQNGGRCDRDAAASCLDPVGCELDDDLIFADSAGGLIDVNINGRADNYVGGCGASAGPEQIIAITFAEPVDVIFEIAAADYDTLLYLRAPCDGADAEIDCNDDHFDDPPLPDGLWSRLHLQLDPGTYFLFVEGYNGQTGRATISIDVNPLP